MWIFLGNASQFEPLKNKTEQNLQQITKHYI